MTKTMTIKIPLPADTTHGFYRYMQCKPRRLAWNTAVVEFYRALNGRASPYDIAAWLDGRHGAQFAIMLNEQLQRETRNAPGFGPRIESAVVACVRRLLRTTDKADLVWDMELAYADAFCN